MVGGWIGAIIYILAFRLRNISLPATNMIDGAVLVLHVYSLRKVHATLVSTYRATLIYPHSISVLHQPDNTTTVPGITHVAARREPRGTEAAHYGFISCTKLRPASRFPTPNRFRRQPGRRPREVRRRHEATSPVTRQKTEVRRS